MARTYSLRERSAGAPAGKSRLPPLYLYSCSTSTCTVQYGGYKRDGAPLQAPPRHGLPSPLPCVQASDLAHVSRGQYRSNTERLFSLAGNLSDDNGKMCPENLATWTSVGANMGIYQPFVDQVMKRYLLCCSATVGSPRPMPLPRPMLELCLSIDWYLVVTSTIVLHSVMHCH